MKSKEAPEIACLRQPDYLSNLKRYFPHLFHAPSFLIYSTKYYAHQASNAGHIFHVAFQEELGTADIALTGENHCVIRIRSLKCVTAIQGVRENTLYLLRAENIVLRATIVDGRLGRKKAYKPRLQVLETKLVENSPSFNIASCPYRAVCNGEHVRLVPLECNPSKTLGTVILDFMKHFADSNPLAKNSVMHRGYLIVFEFGEKRSCRKVADRVIIVTSPLFGNFSTSMLHLVYSMDHFNYVYLFVPAFKTLLVVDPTMLRFSENELHFKDEWKFEENDCKLINLIGVCDGIVSIGFPGFDITTDVQCRQIINYYVWRGKIPRPINWTTVNRDESGKEDITNGSKENNPTDKLIYEAIQTRLEQGIARSKKAVLASTNEKTKPATAASWNVDVPAFVPKVREPLRNEKPALIPTQKEVISSEASPSICNEDANDETEEPFDVIKFAEEVKTDEQTQTEEDELASLKRENKILENQLKEQQDRVKILRRSNEELKAKNEEKKKEQAANLEKLRTHLQLLKESNNILEKSMGEPISKAHNTYEEDNQESRIFEMNEKEINRESDQGSEESEAPDWDDVDVENVNIDDYLNTMVEATAREFEGRCGSGITTEDDISTPWIAKSPIVKPIGIEKKRKEKEDFILNNISSFVPDWSSSLALGSNLDGSNAPEIPQGAAPMRRLQQSSSQPSILPSLARSSTPFGALFSGENFTTWSKTEASSSGWDAIKSITKEK